MSTPKVQPLLLPVLRAIKDGNEHEVKDIRDRVAEELGIKVEEQNEIHSKSRQKIYVNHVAFALAYFNMGKAINKKRKGCYQITARGSKLLAKDGSGLTIEEAKSA